MHSQTSGKGQDLERYFAFAESYLPPLGNRIFDILGQVSDMVIDGLQQIDFQDDAAWQIDRTADTLMTIAAKTRCRKECREELKERRKPQPLLAKSFVHCWRAC